MNRKVIEKKYQSNFFFLLYLFALIILFALKSHIIYSNSETFITIKGPVNQGERILIRNDLGIYDLNIQDEKFPSQVSWTWSGEGQVWATVQYSDRNIVYYLMGNSKSPKVENITFIDENGVPRVLVPRILRIPQGEIRLDFRNAYHKYFGEKSASVEKVQFHIISSDSVEIKDFQILKYGERVQKTKTSGLKLGETNKKMYLGAQIPQGNSKDYYMVKDKVSPIEISLKGLVNEEVESYLKIQLPENLEIISFNNKKLRFTDDTTLIMPIYTGPGYYEEKIILVAKTSGSGIFKIEAKLGEDIETISKNILSISEEKIRNSLSLLDEGVYPLHFKKHEMILKKELKNNIKIKENVSDFLHRVFGREEEDTHPAGMAVGVLKNDSELQVPLHIKFTVLDEKNSEILHFRGKILQDEEGYPAPVPETNIIINPNSSIDFKMPVFADAYYVKPGIYRGQLKVSLFGSDTDIIKQEFDLTVHKETQMQTIVAILSIILSIFCLILFCIKQRKWLTALKNKEIMFIALFTAIKFSVVDVPWFVFGKVINGILAPLGPFIHIFTGIFWDLLNSLLLVTLIMLIPKPGIVIISTVVRIILKGIAFGSFNPVAILLMLSYSIITDGFLYLAGFTSGKREFGLKFEVFVILGLIFGIQHIYSSYAYYYIWMYLYRMFYPVWYININVLFSVVYSIVGSISGVYLGSKLKKVID